MNASVANDAVAPDANRMNQMVEIKVPELGESIQEVQISQWLKKEGEWVEKDDDLVELESEKALRACLHLFPESSKRSFSRQANLRPSERDW